MTIPTDIQAALGDLTDKQRGVIERLVATVGQDRARALVREAQARLAASNPSDPSAPKTVRGALTTLIQTTLPVPERNPILGLALPQYSLPPELHQRYLALCARLNETEPPPRKLIRQVILALGIEAVEQAATEAEAIEAQGGMLLPDGSRRRTLGGVFFVLIRQRMTAEQREPFPLWRDRPARAPKPEGTPPAAPPQPQLPAFVWKERKAIYEEVLQACGEGRVKVTVIGRPGRVVERQDVVITSVKQTKVPALPK
ncbi:MAG TPA: hypothetical protein VGE07_29610, partial [Herpetosiphonaceae bacterium]